MRPSKGTKTCDVWDAADFISKDCGRMATRKEVVEHCSSQGWNANTANTQYGTWKRETFPNAQQSRSASIDANPQGRANILPADEKKCHDRDWSDLLKNGFSYDSDWNVSDRGEIFLDREAPRESGVYVFVLDSEVVYVGVTQRTLAARMSDYRRGHLRQRTSARVKKLISEALVTGSRVKVLYATPGCTEWNGFSVEIAPGLEFGLIRKYKPKWNKQGL